MERVEPAPRSVPWLTVASGAYLMVTAWLLIRLVVGVVAVERLRRGALALESGLWKESLEHWQSRLGLSGPVRLASTDRMSVPVVLGWLRPTVLVPEGLVKGASRATIDAVLLHELAHVRRGDYFWNVLWKLAQALYWPQPLVWVSDRLASSTRERACDALCVRWLEDVSSYRSTLVELAAGLTRRPPVALGMTMARSSKLGRRLADLERNEGADSCRSSGFVRWVVGVIFLAMALTGGLLKPGTSAVLAGSMVVPEDDRTRLRMTRPGRFRSTGGKLPTKRCKRWAEYRLVKPRKALVRAHHLAAGGTAVARVTIDLYAKQCGFIKTLNVDIGSKVKAGEVLAEIDAPEVATEMETGRRRLWSSAGAAGAKFEASKAKFKASEKGRESM